MINAPWMKGFNIVELLTIVTILGILGVVAIPAYDTIIKRKQLQTATEDIYSYLKLAHSESIKRQASFYVSFQSGTNWCYGLDDGSANCSCSSANDCTVQGVETVKKSSDYKNVSLAVSGFGASGLQYEGIRGTANAAGSITLSLGDLSTTVAVNKIGLVTVCSNQMASYPSCS